MKTLVILPQPPGPDASLEEGALTAVWTGRGGADFISLEEELEKRLLQIRGEHMQWAYATGKKDLGRGRTLAEHLGGGEAPSMWWTSLVYERHPKLSPQLYPIYMLRCVELLAEEHGCRAITLHGGALPARLALAGLCARRGWRFSASGKSGKAPREFSARLYYAFPAPLRALARLGHWLCAVFAKTRRRGLERQMAGPRLPATIATYFPNIDLEAAAQGRFHSRYWEELHAALNRQARAEGDGHFVNWLFIRFPAPGLSFRQCLRLRDSFQAAGKDGLNFAYLEEFLGWRDICFCLWRWLKLCLVSATAQNKFAAACVFEGSGLNFWRYMRQQWAESFRGWRCLERCLQNRACRNYFKTAGRQRWTLFPLENCPWERMLTAAARDAGAGNIYGAQHSIIRPTDFRYFDAPATFVDPECCRFQPDIFGSNGKSASDQWLANGMPKTRLRQLEALRYLYLTASAPAAPAQQTWLPPQAGEPLAWPDARRLLVVTSFFGDETREHLRLLAQVLDQGILAGWRITLKPHPYLAVTPWLAARPKEQQKMIRLSLGPMAQELGAATHVWASNSTTAVLEAALRNLPVMVMLPHKDFDLCPIQNIPGLWRTGAPEDVRSGLANMQPLSFPADYLDLHTGLRSWRRMLKLDYP